MIVMSSFTLWCDFCKDGCLCSEPEPRRNPYSYPLIVKAKAGGWGRVGVKDCCPRCAALLLREAEPQAAEAPTCSGGKAEWG